MSPTVPCEESPPATHPPGTAPSGGRRDRAIRSQERDGVVVLRPAGQLDRAGVAEVHQAASDLADRPVIIDLTDCILTEPNALGDLADDDGDQLDVCFVSHRSTCRILLARTGVTSRFAVFHHVEDALQARALARAGYGPGWRRSVSDRVAPAVPDRSTAGGATLSGR